MKKLATVIIVIAAWTFTAASLYADAQCYGDCASEQGQCIGDCQGDGQCINRCGAAHGRCVSRCD